MLSECSTESLYVKYNIIKSVFSSYRIAGGEPLIFLPALIPYYGYIPKDNVQKFPFRTFTMLLSFGTILVVSYLMKYLFEKKNVRKEWDIFQCIVNIPEETVVLKDPYDRPPTPSPMAEMAILKGKPIGIMSANGQINPALKFSKDDLLRTNGGDASQITRLTPE